MSKHFNDKFRVPIITRQIKLSEYAPEFGEQVVEVWVNPPRKVMRELFEISQQFVEINREINPAEDVPAQSDGGPSSPEDVSPSLAQRPDGNASSSRPEGEMSVASPHDPPLDRATIADSSKLTERLKSITGKLYDWYANIWSQGKDAGNHWSAVEIRQMVEGARETDPAFWPWLTKQSMKLINDHRAGRKKD